MSIGRSTMILSGLFLVFCVVATFCLAGGPVKIGKHGLVIGKDIHPAKFREFYYTVSSTTDPPKFQRYRFYIANGKPAFYHEKREGKKVFLTERDITVSGTIPLAAADWEKFWSLLAGGTVSDRVELETTGGSGPWLYLYWDGDKGKKQVYEFPDSGALLAFENFCLDLKAREMGQRGQ